MKKYLLLVAFGFVMCSNAAGQTYHPFPTTNGNWLYQYYDQFHNPTGQFTNILLSGDTIIGANTYKKLSGGYPIGEVYGNCLREDNKIIYYYHPDSAAEYVLYNFNLQIGDTLFNPYSWNFPSQSDTVLIIGLDSILLADNQYHKQWHGQLPSDFCPMTWIEGVGSPLTFFTPYHPCLVSAWYSLECFTNDSIFVYENANSSFSCITGKQKVEYNASATIYPNPFTDKFIITINTNESSQLFLYDITSRKLLEQTFINSVSINTTQLEGGIYFYEVRSGNKIIGNGKVIKE